MREQKVKIVIDGELSINDINTIIKQEVCYKTLE
jgi:TusA-related sulfurtransferase